MDQIFQFSQAVLFTLVITIFLLIMSKWALELILNKLNNPIVGVVLFFCSIIIIKEIAGYGEEWKLLSVKTYLPSILIAYIVFKSKLNLTKTIKWTVIFVTVGNVFFMYVFMLTLYFPKGLTWLPLGYAVPLCLDQSYPEKTTQIF